jgi:hypothetical protein
MHIYIGLLFRKLRMRWADANEEHLLEALVCCLKGEVEELVPAEQWHLPMLPFS